MVRKCCVDNCSSESYGGCNISFHSFPKNEVIKRKWHIFLGETPRITKNSVVCSRHFEPTCFYTATSRQMLKADAVPTICSVGGENSKNRVTVEVDVMNDDWQTKGGSIWNQGQERATTRVKCRATTCQLVQLVKFMEKHKELAVSHTQPFPGSEQLWEQLAEHINQFGPPKTPKQCKTTWRDLRKRAFAMMRTRNKDKSKVTGRNLYGMAPKIISLITTAGQLPKSSGLTPASKASSSQASAAKSPMVEPASNQGVIKVEKTSSGDQLVIRVTDKLDSKTNVFNRFSVSDGHFENNIIVKEEREDPQQDAEGSSEHIEAEVDQTEYSQPEEMYPAAENIINQGVSEEACKILRDLNDTLSRYVAEYSDRTLLLRERLELDRARLQFDMEVFRSQSNKRKNDQGDAS